MDSIRSAQAGLLAQEQRLDAIANNISNVNTPGFKSARPDFSDLLYQQAPAGNAVAAGVGIGNGARISGVSHSDEEGTLQQTDSPTDLAINGSGYFAVQRADRSYAYTRNGSFALDADGQLVTGTGDKVFPPLRVPPGSTDIQIADDGRVTAKLANGQTGQIGRIQVAVFANDGGLAAVGNSLFVPTANSGRAQLQNPGTNNAGQLRQGMLESSNVSLTEEMTQMIEAERNFQMLTRTISASDQMAQMGNNLKG